MGYGLPLGDGPDETDDMSEGGELTSEGDFTVTVASGVFKDRRQEIDFIAV